MTTIAIKLRELSEYYRRYSDSVKLTSGSTAYSAWYGNNSSISSAAYLVEMGRYIEIMAIKVSYRRFSIYIFDISYQMKCRSFFAYIAYLFYLLVLV